LIYCKSVICDQFFTARFTFKRTPGAFHVDKNWSQDDEGQNLYQVRKERDKEPLKGAAHV